VKVTRDFCDVSKGHITCLLVNWLITISEQTSINYTDYLSNLYVT